MKAVVDALSVGGYLLAILVANGYARLLIPKPREQRTIFLLTWAAIGCLLLTVFRIWGVPEMTRFFGRQAATEQLKSTPGLARLMARHPGVHAAYDEFITTVVFGNGDPAAEKTAAASQRFVTIVGRYENAYLAIASDAALRNYASDLAITMEALNDDGSGAACGAVLNQRWDEIYGMLMNNASLRNRVAKSRDAVLLSAFVEPGAPLSFARRAELDVQLEQFMVAHFGPVQSKVMMSMLMADAPNDDPEICTALVEIFGYALGLPGQDGNDMIRALFPPPEAEPESTEPRASDRV